MRVLAFSDVAPGEGSGGVERTLAEVYGRMATVHAIRLLALSAPQSPSSTFSGASTEKGLDVVRCAKLPLERLTGAQTALSWSIWRAALREAEQFRPDVVHAHTLFFHSSLAAVAASRRARVPLVTTAHVGSMRDLPQPHRALVQLYESSVGRVILRSSSKIICVSADVEAHMRSLGVPDFKLSVVPNGVDLNLFQPSSHVYRGAPLVVSVGRLIFNKGPAVLLAAAKLLRRDGLKFQIAFVGDGPLRSKLKREVQRAGLEGFVLFMGHRTDIHEILQRAAIFVRPSFSEGMSLAVLEAMACGLPVIVTDVSGSRELIEDGVQGFIVQSGDAEELARRIKSILINRELGRDLGRAAREKASRFTWDACAAATARALADA